MKYKTLLAAAAVGVAGFGLASASDVSAFTDYFKDMDDVNSSYYMDSIKHDIECPSGTVEYKVSQDYDESKHVWFRVDGGCSIIFDINGKKIENGSITVSGGSLTLRDSVGTGYFKNTQSFNDVYRGNLVDGEAYSSSNATDVTIESGEYVGDFSGNRGSLEITIKDGRFSNSTWTGYLDMVSYTIDGGNFANMTFRHNTNYSGRIDIKGGTFKNTAIVSTTPNGDNSRKGHISISGGTFSGLYIGNGSDMVQASISGGEFDNQFSVSLGDGGSLSIYGGTFDTKPDEKYLGDSYDVYEIGGKYVVAVKLHIDYASSFYYIGQNGGLYAYPAFVAKTLDVTSSDSSVIKVSYEDIAEDANSMYAGARQFTLEVLKPGKTTVSYTTDYGHSGSYDVYVSPINASAYGATADFAKQALVSFATCAVPARANGDIVKLAADVYANCGVGPGPSEETIAKRDKLAEALKTSLKLKLTLAEKITNLSDAELEALKGKMEEQQVEGYNVGPIFELEGSVLYSDTDEVIIDGWTSSVTETGMGGFLLGSGRNLKVAAISEYAPGSYIIPIIDAEEKDGAIVFDERSYISGQKYVLLYDGDPIAPAVPNSGAEENLSEAMSSVVIIGTSLGAGAVLLLLALYAKSRLATRRRIRF